MITTHSPLSHRLMVNGSAQLQPESERENDSILAGFIHIIASLCGLVSPSIILWRVKDCCNTTYIMLPTLSITPMSHRTTTVRPDQDIRNTDFSTSQPFTYSFLGLGWYTMVHGTPSHRVVYFSFYASLNFVSLKLF